MYKRQALAVTTRRKYEICERGRGLDHVTPRKFGIPSSISPKLLKLQTSNFEHSFPLALPTRGKYDISEKGRGLGHVTPRKFGIPSTIYRKSNEARDFKFGMWLRLGPFHNTEQ